MHDADRFIDGGHFLTQFADRVLVRCSRCDAVGLVIATSEINPRQGVFRCAACGLNLARAKGDWVGPVVIKGYRACGQCGYRISSARSLPSCPASLPKTAKVTCAQCRQPQEIDVAVLPDWPPDRCIDPHLGLPLLLSAATRHGVIWAYNERHLAELKGYVAARLRIRRGTGNGTMFSRYPAWIKAAKNRDLVLKALGRLEAKLTAA